MSVCVLYECVCIFLEMYLQRFYGRQQLFVLFALLLKLFDQLVVQSLLLYQAHMHPTRFLLDLQFHLQLVAAAVWGGGNGVCDVVGGWWV
jgi:hypothetical protein